MCIHCHKLLWTREMRISMRSNANLKNILRCHNLLNLNQLKTKIKIQLLAKGSWAWVAYIGEYSPMDYIPSVTALHDGGKNQQVTNADWVLGMTCLHKGILPYGWHTLSDGTTWRRQKQYDEYDTYMQPVVGSCQCTPLQYNRKSARLTRVSQRRLPCKSDAHDTWFYESRIPQTNIPMRI